MFSRFLNRELSWLEFNQRVLEEAQNPSTPLLERLKFLAISGSNLDEFFQVRVGGLHLQIERGENQPDSSGLTPRQQLEKIRAGAGRMMADQHRCFLEQLEPVLENAGLRRLSPEKLSHEQSRTVEEIFLQEIHPVLSPIALAPGDPFPLLFDQPLNLGVRLEPHDGQADSTTFAVIPLSQTLDRFLSLHGGGERTYILLEDVTAMFVDRFFPGRRVLETAPFRITRNADMRVEDDYDLMSGMQEVLEARKQGDCVRLELSEQAGTLMRDFLQQNVPAPEETIFTAPGPLDLSALMRLTDLSGMDSHRYPTWTPQPSPLVDPHAGMFEILARQDLLLTHPYESFDPVVRLVEEAADDPDVLAIKQILYRTSRDSRIVSALRRAAENGKHVTVIVELRARFDEARNIEWARRLERSSVQVIYGVRGLKTHAKLCLVIRREPQGVQRYVHLGTGNYNESTARLYTDISYLTCDEEFGADAAGFFHAVGGDSQPQMLRKIAAAPLGLRARLLELIEGETERKRQNQPAKIVAKMNSLSDPQIIEALYEASQAGVEIRLNVRGVCCLRPGVEGLSENIRVVSIVDRLLEHSRIAYFHHGGAGRLFISSADWMTRNLDKRVELLTPVEDSACRQLLLQNLEAAFQDTAKARRLLPDGSYQLVAPAEGEPPVSSQAELYARACEAANPSGASQRNVFQPLRAM